MRIETTQYQWTHGKKPRCCGWPACWWFKADGEMVTFHGRLGEAKKHFRRLRVMVLEILP